ncbi:MAG: transposase [Candidatus Cloacimonetes bacterium]|nr:transposase [Candidatus Cloacimonadota bacterium]
MVNGVKNRRVYSDEFKSEAVKKALQPGAVVQKVARELGVSGAVLNRWVLKARALEGGKDLKTELEQLKAELKAMKKKAELLEMERDILKKATAFFAKDLR